VSALTHLSEADDLDRALHAAGLRVTAQRRALLDTLRARGGFMDAETLHELAALRGVRLSLATVYRTLSALKEAGLVEGRAVGGERGPEEFRFRSARDTYTLVCRRCGAIVPVEPDIVDAFRREAAQRLGVTVLGAHSCFVGACAACTAALARESD